MIPQLKTKQATVLGFTALNALLFEASLSPKPGLVTPFSTGSHNDMDYLTFVKSSAALAPFLVRYALLGLTHSGSPESLFKEIRTTGQQAEQVMLAATNNINTHKGANFSFAILLGAAGKIMQNKRDVSFSIQELSLLFDYTKQMATGLVAKDFSHLEKKKSLSYGETLYLTHGITGIRGEAEAGYPTLQQKALPFLRHSKEPNERTNYLWLLLYLLSEVEDANLINRGGLTAWHQVKSDALSFFHSLSTPVSQTQLVDILTTFDHQLVNQHLSPGGTADLLALSYFFNQLETK